MNKKIDNPADCEVRSAIRFLNAQKSFWLSSCREAQPSTPNRTVQLSGGYGTPFKTEGGAFCEAA
jgi:hypothetical protein